jgi:type II secretory pathway component GspD/PulD (secretin)
MFMAAAKKRLGALALSLAALWLLHDLQAQNVYVSGQAESKQPASAARIRKQKIVQPATSAESGAQPSKPDVKPTQPGEKKGKPDDAKKTDTAPKTTQRPTEPPTPPDPDELKLRPDKHGKLRFNFHGQPWPDLLEWLAGVSGMSLDWQEVPADYLNLVTQRSYTVDEARDLINSHLLSRGFTMLRHGEVLSVVNIKKLNPAMVPRVTPDELQDRSPHEFVKVSFRLDWLLAEKAVEEFKPMLSPNGKLVKLTATNRLEAIDVVINLREIHTLLTEEQSAGGQQRLVQEFKLQYTRAGDVIEQLKTLLGIEKSSKSAAAMTPQQRQQAQQRAMLAARQASQKKPAASASKPKADIHLVVNNRENSILAYAPPDKMAIITQTIKLIDVPSAGTNSLLRNINRMQIYRLAAIDPEPLVKVLEELGQLDFDTRLEIDKQNKAIIAYASLADHATIRVLVDKLDGSGREFHVIRLRRLESDYVAGTIQFMMGGEEEKQPRNDYYYYRYGSGSQTNETKDKFRVDSDVEHNRLLLWANDIEVKEVENLLVKLGEIRVPGSNSSTIRVIDSAPGKETEELLRRIRLVWPSLGPNKLLVVPPAGLEEQPVTPPEEESLPPASPSKNTTTQFVPDDTQRSGSTKLTSKTDDDRSVNRLAAGRTNQPFLRIVRSIAWTDQPARSLQALLEPDAAQPGTNDSSGDAPKSKFGPRQPPPSVRQFKQGNSALPPPISITIGPDGRLVISSQDTRALDQLEELMSQLAPPRKNYQVFHLKYADAFWVKVNLEEYFEDDEKKDGDSGFNPYYFGYPPSSGKTETTRRLSRRRPLRFIYDSDTNTILVQGGDAGQLKTVTELIELYDQPQKTDSNSLRKSKTFKIQYSQAKVIAETIKDVYRDLLSANDKALASNQQQKPKTESRYTYIYGDVNEDSGQKIPKFKGALSIGVDDVSNTLVVSAQPYLLSDVGSLIEDLDEAAKPPTISIRIVQTHNADAFKIHQAIARVLGQPAPVVIAPLTTSTTRKSKQRPAQVVPQQSSDGAKKQGQIKSQEP